MQPKVSIIIPVYNAEKYIERCARSLFGQTLDSLEFIFVDDCSPDNSIAIIQDILEEFPNRKPQVKLIHHTSNQGVGKTRQDGVDMASGEYIIHCDPDDWVEQDMYEIMIKNAERKIADIVSSGFVIENHNGQQIIENNNFINSDYRFHLISDNWAVLWRHMIKATIAKQIRFTDGVDAGEDYIYICKSICIANKITIVNQPLYHYNRTNPTSIIATPNHNKLLQQVLATTEVAEIIPTKYKQALELRKLSIKDQMLQYGINYWRTTFPETLGYNLPIVSLKRKLVYLTFNFLPCKLIDLIFKIINGAKKSVNTRPYSIIRPYSLDTYL